MGELIRNIFWKNTVTDTSFLNFVDVPLNMLLKDPAAFQQYLYDTTKLSPRVVSELFNSTVNVQKVSAE